MTENNRRFWRRYCQIWIYFLTDFLFLKASTSYCYQVKCYLACFSCLHSVSMMVRHWTEAFSCPFHSSLVLCTVLDHFRENFFSGELSFTQWPNSNQQALHSAPFFHSVIPLPIWFMPRLLTEINSAKLSSTSTFIYTWIATQTAAPVPSEGDRGCAEILEENYIWYLTDNLHLHRAWVILTDGINSLHGKYKWKWLQALQL